MRILYFTPKNYDFLAAAVVDGLNVLSHERRIQLVTTTYANYAHFGQVWSPATVRRHGKGFDFFILGTGEGVDHDLFWETVKPGAGVCIDGSDSSLMTHEPERFVAYFKRELTAAVGGNLHPLPFVVERRWRQPLNRSPRLFLTALFGPRSGLRAETLQRLAAWKIPNSRLGPVSMSRTSVVRGILKGQCTLRTWRTWGFGVGHNAPYYRLLHDGLASLSVPGDGLDTARWWEILGSGALLISPRLGLHMPHPFIPGEHFLQYESLDHLKDLLESIRGDRVRADAVRMAARRHCDEFHSPVRRAAQVVAVLEG